MKKGKNYSKNNGKRSPRDFYQTPFSMTKQFLDLGIAISKDKVWEPSCGKGAIVSVMRDAGHEVYFSDINMGFDFLSMQPPMEVKTIITNPPFLKSIEFIKRCKEIATERFVLLMDLEYLHGAQRFYEIYNVTSQWVLSSVNIFIRRPMLTRTTRKDGKYKTGMTTYAWYVWTKIVFPERSEPKIRWIDNNQYVLRRRK
jgi:hypothetical protein